MRRNDIIIALIFLLLGFFLAYYFTIFKTQEEPETTNNTIAHRVDTAASGNPFVVASSDSPEDERLNYLEDEVGRIQRQLQEIELTLQELTKTPAKQLLQPQASVASNFFSSSLNRRIYNIKSLIQGGIDSVLAEDIVRRKNSYELKRLELLDRANRDNYLNTQRYYDELEEINSRDVNLRDELGDDRYDEYLYASKQNNRIKIASVMLGSNAEQVGIQNGDVVVSYDDNRMFSWPELKNATTEGELGEYVSISIYRNGEIFSFSVPRGPLGIQLGATRLQP